MHAMHARAHLVSGAGTGLCAAALQRLPLLARHAAGGSSDRSQSAEGIGVRSGGVGARDDGNRVGDAGEERGNVVPMWVGVDLSPQMLGQAHQKGLYDTLVLGDATQWMVRGRRDGGTEERRAEGNKI